MAALCHPGRYAVGWWEAGVVKVLEGKVSNEGRVVIPIDIRHSMGLAAGDRVQFVLADDGEVRLVTARSLAHALWARNTGGDAVDTGELVRAVREAGERGAVDAWADDDLPSAPSGASSHDDVLSTLFPDR
jgi:AbrB family looped-hinge helix DNA binding protein